MNLSIFYLSTALFLTRKCCTCGWPISAAPSRKLDTFAEGLVAVAAAGVVYVSCWTGSGRWGCIGARHTDYCAQVDAGQLCFHLWGSITSSSLVQTPSSIEMPQLFGSESHVKTVMQANWPG